jgi:hypothetical protein
MALHWVKFTVVFVIASALLLAGFFISWYPSSRIQSLETQLDQSGLTQAEIDNLESSLSWWRNQGVFTYGSVSNFVFAAGALALVYAIAYSLLSTWRESIKAKLIYTKQLEASQTKSEEQPKQTRTTVKTGFPIASGVLTIIASSMVMLFSGMFLVGGIQTLSSRSSPQVASLVGDGVFGIVVFAFALTGGIMTLRRKNFVLAILGACFLITKGCTFIVATGGVLLGSVLGIVTLALSIIGLIFVSISYKEFS